MALLLQTERCFEISLQNNAASLFSLTWLCSAPFQLGSQDKAAAAENDTPARTVGLKCKRRTGRVTQSLSINIPLPLSVEVLISLPPLLPSCL